MPTYDYECNTCGYTFEAFQSMSDDPLTKCPECGKKVRRLIGGGIGVIFKGSGFYVTDNKKSNSTLNTTSTEKKKSDDSKAAGESKSTSDDKSGKKESKKSEKKTA